MNRREFLGVGAGLTLTSMQDIVFAANQNDKSVILVWLGGGASFVEIGNPLPDGQEKFRSVRGHIQSSIPGLYLGADMVNLSKITDMTVVRSMSSKDSNHSSATMEYMTSERHIPNQSQNFPSYGAVISQRLNSYRDDGIPRYVKVAKIEGDDAAFLGSSYNGFDLDREGIDNLKPRVAQNQFDRRIYLMNEIDKVRSQAMMDKEWIGIKESAVKVVKGETSKAIDLKNVDQNTLNKYNTSKSNFGRDCLIAKRLVEAGVSFVNISMGGFDLHSGIYCGMGRLLPELDTYLSIMVNDLKQSGKLKDTLIVVTSEFSRTPLNNTAGETCVGAPHSYGKDHWAPINTLIFLGGGYNHKGWIGSTDKMGLTPETTPFTPKDLGKTIYSHFGINELTLTDNRGRPRHIIESNSKNILT